MIKLCIVAMLLMGLSACSQWQTGKRAVASEEPKGNETGNRVNEETVEGIIKQAECNKLTGFGTIELQVKKDRVIETTWYKVNSKELCSKEIPSQYFLGNATVLTNLSAENVTSEHVTISTIRIVDDFVVEINPVKKVNYQEYTKRVRGYESIGNNREVLEWYFQNRKSQ